MAKRGRPPKGCTVDQLDAELRGRIDEAVRSHADESAASIYRRFGLAQRGVIVRTFRAYTARIRRQAAGERIDAAAAAMGEAAEMSEAEMVAQLRRRVLVGALAAADAGDAKPYEMAAMLARIQEFDRIEIQRAADKRAEDLHQVKMRTVNKELKSEVEKLTEAGAKQATRGEICDLIDQVMRGRE
jgi:hypothetical protein